MQDTEIVASDDSPDEAIQRRNRNAKPVKKGTRSWAPSAPLGIKSRDPAYRLRWVNTEPSNMLRKRSEGWEPATRHDAVHDRPSGVESGAGTPAGVLEYRDMVLMKIPEEMAQERAAYYQNQARQQLSGLTTRAKADINAKTGALVDGDIKID
jgi:hypothetical protein